MSISPGTGVHPGPDRSVSAIPAVADWQPGTHRSGNAFDELFRELEPALHAKIAEYEQPRSALIPMAQMFQDREGWTSPNALAVIAHLLGLPAAVVESTISFYTLFFRKPIGRYLIQPCRNLSCLINGAGPVMERFRERLGIGHLETTPDGLFSYEEVECLAACDRAPCAQVNLEFVYDLTDEKIDAMLAAMRAGTFEIAPLPQTLAPERTWKLEQDTGRKSAGALGVESPNDPGGIGDRSGVIMLDRVVNDPAFAQRSRERLVREPNLRVDPSGGGHH